MWLTAKVVKVLQTIQKTYWGKTNLWRWIKNWRHYICQTSNQRANESNLIHAFLFLSLFLALNACVAHLSQPLFNRWDFITALCSFSGSEIYKKFLTTKPSPFTSSQCIVKSHSWTRGNNHWVLSIINWSSSYLSRIWTKLDAREDSGILPDKNQLPVRQMTFSNTNGPPEVGLHTLGN